MYPGWAGLGAIRDFASWQERSSAMLYNCSPAAKARSMNEQRLAAMHWLLAAEDHRKLAKEAVLDVAAPVIEKIRKRPSRP